MSLKTETAKVKENKDNMKKVKAATDSTLVELGGEASTSLNDVPNKIRSLGTNLVSKIGDLNDLKTTDKTNIVNAINELFQNRIYFKSELFEKTLIHTDWQDDIYNLDTEFPSANCDIEIELSGNATKEHAKAWGKAIPVSDPTNKNNIKILGYTPEIDIPVKITKNTKGIMPTGEPISWNDLVDKPSTFAPEEHVHLASSITEDESHKFVTSIEKEKINSPSKVECKKMSITDWTLDEGIYKKTINHRLNTANVFIEVYSEERKINQIVSYRIVDENNIEICSKDNRNIDVLILSGEPNNL